MPKFACACHWPVAFCFFFPFIRWQLEASSQCCPTRKQVWYWFQWVLYKQDSTKQRSLKDNSGLNIAFFGTFWHFIRNNVNCSWTNLKFVSQTILNVWKILLGTFWVFLHNTLKCSQNNSLMLRNIFWNVLLTFLKVQNYFQNMLALFRALWFVLYKIWLCFIEQFWTFDNFFLNFLGVLYGTL